ncbi:uncharacterized protein YbjT (DUF2867 family) [Luteibacter sp. OK325]|jgi:uncharacterized protein YbjT (DUF2867 family)|uniref:SDR family oxidoreductase n=1 Tax=Luteibacter sp. OK325 TaxID=2135670 RepID=UPI000D36A2DC|nr:SDR family oxidoreductase [Luteibacter sp. OK325]PTR32521.1 uncharacterized protein YbjT (DUF2867 family) [Luteibacter sp. OK325]
MNILVVGGYGLVGRNVVARLRSAGHVTTAVSRSTGVDLTTGKGLAQALSGVDVVVDVSNASSFNDISAFEFFKVAIENLLMAEAEAGVGHHVSLSVVGTGLIDDSHYLRGKALQEELIQRSGIPFTVVQATQFYEFLVDIVSSAIRDQTVRLSSAFIQPVASDDVAAVIAHAAVSPAVNGSIQVAGPNRERLFEIVQRFLLDIEAPCEVILDADAPYFGAVLSERVLLPRADARLGARCFQEWLDQSEYARVGW